MMIRLKRSSILKVCNNGFSSTFDSNQTFVSLIIFQATPYITCSNRIAIEKRSLSTIVGSTTSQTPQFFFRVRVFVQDLNLHQQLITTRTNNTCQVLIHINSIIKQFTIAIKNCLIGSLPNPHSSNGELSFFRVFC